MNLALVDKTYALKKLSDILGSMDGADASKGLGSALDFIKQILGLALDLAGMIAVIMVLYGAFLYVTAYGEDARAETAKKTIFWSIIGLIILAAACSAVAIINKEIKG